MNMNTKCLAVLLVLLGIMAAASIAITIVSVLQTKNALHQALEPTTIATQNCWIIGTNNK